MNSVAHTQAFAKATGCNGLGYPQEGAWELWRPGLRDALAANVIDNAEATLPKLEEALREQGWRIERVPWPECWLNQVAMFTPTWLPCSHAGTITLNEDLTTAEQATLLFWWLAVTGAEIAPTHGNTRSEAA